MSATLHDGLQRLLTGLSQDMLLGRWQTCRRLPGGKVIQLLEGKRGTRTVASHGHPGRRSPGPTTVAYIQRQQTTAEGRCRLASYDDVKTHATIIYDRIRGVGGNVMPPPPPRGEGPRAPRIETFDKRISEGCPPNDRSKDIRFLEGSQS